MSKKEQKLYKKEQNKNYKTTKYNNNKNLLKYLNSKDDRRQSDELVDTKVEFNVNNNEKID